MDADGRLVQLSTEKLYTDGGEEFSVYGIIYLLDERVWAARGVSKHSKRLCSHDLRFLHIAKPDSWEQLERDATLAPRDYLGSRGIVEGKDGRIAAMMGDLVSRAKALAGVSE